MLRKMLQQWIADAVGQAQADGDLPSFAFSSHDVPVERPPDSRLGDVATPVALAVAKQQKRTPTAIAEALAERLRRNTAIESVDIAGPGFINIRLKSDIWIKELSEVLHRGPDYGRSAERKGSVSVEFLSVNPTGSLHVAHGRAAFYGDVLARVLAVAGWDVLREYYVNASHHNTQIEELGKAVLGEGEQYKWPMIEELRTQLASAMAQDAMEIGFRAAQIIQKQNQRFITATLGIPFDEWVWEETLFEDGLVDRALAALKKKHALEEREGVLWLKHAESSEGDSWVVVRSSGAPSYLLPDIAYHQLKASRNHDRIIDIFGADHQGHKRKLEAVAELFGFSGALEVIITQMVHLREGGVKKKMSKRAGTAVPLAELIDEVGVDAARFFFLLKSVDTHMEFDVALAKERSQKNPVYYVQYAHTRCAGVLRKAAEEGADGREADLALLSSDEERRLIRKLSEFPEVVDDIARDTGVQRLPHYLMALADVFHHFYHEERILGWDPAVTAARLALVRATQYVLANGLALLGVSAPERM